MSTSKRLVASFIQFLQDQVNNGLLSADSAESLEVGIQCLETAFELPSGDSSLASATPLQEIFEKHLQSHERESISKKQDVSPADKAAAEELKAQGNTHMTNGDFLEAIDCYTKAIELDPTNAVYYCNRCAVHNKLENFQAAIEDANKAIQIDPSYSKAYGRLGLAYTRLRQYQKAVDAYQKAYDLEPDVGSNSRNLKNAQEMLAAHQAESGGAGMEPFGSAGLGGLLGSPAFMSLASRMASHPEMRSVMNNLMTGNMQLNSSGDIDALIQVGQELAQQMRNSNPTLVDELRRQMEGAPGNRSDPAPDAPPK